VLISPACLIGFDRMKRVSSVSQRITRVASSCHDLAASHRATKRTTETVCYLSAFEGLCCKTRLFFANGVAAKF
jgi:hypothetical protein